MTALARRTWLFLGALALSLAALLPSGAARGQSDPLDEPPEGDRPQKPKWTGEIEPPKRLIDYGAIKLATDDSYPPMEFWDRGRIRGLDIDVGKAIAKLLGVEAEFVHTDWHDILPFVKLGRVDGAISSIDVTEERSREVAFVEYMTLRQVFVVRRGAARVEKAEELAGKKVAVQAETTSEAFAKEHAGPEGVTTYATSQLAFAALKKGEAEVIVVDEPVAAHMARGDPRAFEVTGPATPGTPVGIALPKDDEALVKAVKAAVARLRESGELDRIAKKWLAPPKEAPPAKSAPAPAAPQPPAGDDGEDLGK